MLIRPAVIASLLLLPALASCGGADGDEPTAQPSDDATCQYVEDPMGAAREVDMPAGEPTVDGPVTAVIKTSAGDLNLELDGNAAPCTVNSFVSLAKQDFYDDTECPRIEDKPGFAMLQCGDPTGTGTGGPGYTIPDEFAGDETYGAGTVAMARTSQPNSGGSQFFLVFNDTSLPPEYTVFGQLDDAAIKALQKVGAEGNDGSHPAGGGRPTNRFDITDVVIG